MCTEAELYDVFQETGKHFGFLNVKVEFASFSGFKVQWHRINNWIELKITDYLKDAPESVLEDLAQNIFSNIVNGSGEYEGALRDHVLDPEFFGKHRPTFLKRTKYLGGDPDGEYFDLMMIYRKLVREGYLDHADETIHLTWAADDYRLITTSPLMKVVAISYLMDQKSTPDEVVEAAMYEAIQSLNESRRTFGRNDSKPIEWISHPGKKALDGWLKERKTTL